MSPASPSGIALIADAFLAVVLALYFSLGHPRSWFRDRLGWVFFSLTLALAGLLVLLVLGLVLHVTLPAPLIFIVSAGLGAALVAKIAAVYRERREGRLAGARISTERTAMDSSLDTRKLAAVTAIWYKAQRVLRTAFTTVLTVLPIIPQIIAIVQGQWDAAWLAPVAVQAVAINSALTAIIALPTVNAWLTKVGLGSVPRSAVYQSPTSGAVHVKTDPKAIR